MYTMNLNGKSYPLTTEEQVKAAEIAVWQAYEVKVPVLKNGKEIGTYIYAPNKAYPDPSKANIVHLSDRECLKMDRTDPWYNVGTYRIPFSGADLTDARLHDLRAALSKHCRYVWRDQDFQSVTVLGYSNENKTVTVEMRWSIGE